MTYVHAEVERNIKNVMESKIPKIIGDVGFDFHWDSKKVWKLDVPTTDMDIEKLVWHFEIPFWGKGSTNDYNLTPQEVIDRKSGTKEHFEKVKKADLKHPIDIMENKGRFLILDGLHRLVKAYISGMKKVNVRIIPREKIPKIISN